MQRHKVGPRPREQNLLNEVERFPALDRSNGLLFVTGRRRSTTDLRKDLWRGRLLLAPPMPHNADG